MKGEKAKKLRELLCADNNGKWDTYMQVNVYFMPKGDLVEPRTTKNIFWHPGLEI